MNNGADLVLSTATYALLDNVENLTLNGANAISGIGNALDNIIIGNGAANKLVGGAGNDRLDGGTGGDTMLGGTGDDTYVVDTATDFIIEYLSEGVDTIESAITFDLSTTNNIENLTLTGSGLINGTGNALDNVLAGNGVANVLAGDAGNDRLIGGAGNDTLIGGIGNDTYVLDVATDIVTENLNEGIDSVEIAVGYALSANVENLTLTGNAAINGTGNTLDNLMVGNGAANTLDGGVGADTLIGGAGNDTYVIDNALDVVTEALNEGTDLVQSSVAYTLGTNLENLVLTGTGLINGTGNLLDNLLTGNSSANTLDGGAGNDRLNGGTGIDTLKGGLGNDTYVVDTTTDTISENLGEGIDTVESSVTFSLALINNLENLLLTGTATSGTGNGLGNTITGNASANTLNGGTGVDTLIGGAGNDTYVVDNSSDVVAELLNEGTDLVQAGATYTLSTNVENLTLTGTTAINGTGNSGNNVITGNSATNILDGGVGADTLIGGAGNDTYVIDNILDVVTELLNEGTDLVQSSVTYTLDANLENLTLIGVAAINGIGNGLANILIGNAAANTLDGGTGIDTLVGGVGNDTYVVDNILDVVTELLNEGIDLVQAGATYALSANVENLTLTGTGLINGTGNALDNVLTGNGVANILVGGAGNDRLVGGAGNDTMQGGTGNDTYVVDVNTDILVENLNEGIDTVETGITYSLNSTANANIENLTLTGTAVTGTGNALDNVLTGNGAANTLVGGAGNDRLIGGAGNDTLQGGTGNDTYVLDVATDIVTENANEGTDMVEIGVSYTLRTNVENLTLTGSGAANGTGNTANNVVVGNNGANILNGKAGNDSLTGGSGADIFLFDTALNAATNKDTIFDFSVVDDTIRLENAIFTKFTAIGAISAANFVSGAGAKALDNNDYLIYNTSNGSLYYDADGSGAGAQVEFLTLTGIPPITAADFAVV